MAQFTARGGTLRYDQPGSDISDGSETAEYGLDSVEYPTTKALRFANSARFRDRIPVEISGEIILSAWYG
jgi:hypothetical protein